MFCRMFFVFHKFISRYFLYCLWLFIITRNLNTTHTPTESKQNLLIEFFSSQGLCLFCQATKHFSRRVQSFSQSYKISFFNDDSRWIKKCILVLIFRMLVNKLFRVTTNVQPQKLFFSMKMNFYTINVKITVT